MPLTGRTALVTGASRGIGLAIAKELSRRGSNVVLMARDERLLRHNVEKELYKGHHHYLDFDIRNLAQIKDVAKDPSLKNLSILIHCAGISQASLLISTPQTQIEDIITTNLTAPIMLTQALIKPLIKNKPSSVTFLSSVLGLRGLKGTSVYATTKSGLAGFSRAMARELGAKDIRFNCVSPGLVKDTSMGEDFHFDTALCKDSVSIEDVVSSVLYTVENRSVTGENLVVDNGYMC